MVATVTGVAWVVVKRILTLRNNFLPMIACYGALEAALQYGAAGLDFRSLGLSVKDGNGFVGEAAHSQEFR